jgi:hypothetical protein
MLTINLTTNSGAVPSAGSPCILPFRSATANNGAVITRNISAATSLTLSSGSTLGVGSANSPFSLWIVAFDDAGAVRLGAINCRSGGNVFPLGRTNPRASSTAEGGAGAAGNTHTFYTDTAVTTKAYCILGRLEWASGLASPGSWIEPSAVEPWHVNMKLPGDVVQTVQSVKTDTFSSSVSGSFTDITGLSATITPTSTANLVKATPRVQATEAGGNGCAFSLIRASTIIGGGAPAGIRIPAFGGLTRIVDNASIQTVTAIVFDAPGTASGVTYKVQFVLQGGTLCVNRSSSDADLTSFGRYSSSVTLEEIQA